MGNDHLIYNNGDEQTPECKQINLDIEEKFASDMIETPSPTISLVNTNIKERVQNSSKFCLEPAPDSSKFHLEPAPDSSKFNYQIIESTFANSQPKFIEPSINIKQEENSLSEKPERLAVHETYKVEESPPPSQKNNFLEPLVSMHEKSQAFVSHETYSTFESKAKTKRKAIHENDGETKESEIKSDDDLLQILHDLNETMTNNAEQQPDSISAFLKYLETELRCVDKRKLRTLQYEILDLVRKHIQ